MNKFYIVKKIPFFQIITLVVIVIISVNCTKELPVTSSGNTSVIINPPPPNRPPVANAGVNFMGKLYSNEMTLRGHAYDPDMGNTLSIIWTRIAGSVCTIVSPHNRTTALTGLLVGDYQFELSVSDNYGGTDRDTVNVKINSIEPITSPLNFFNLSWSCPMGCTIPIYDIYKYIPSNTPIRVFIKLINTATWHEALPMSQYSGNSPAYYYEIDSDNNIFLYTDYESINVDVKILF